MIYTKLTKKAMNLMFDKHKNQVDKSGAPYVFHPWHVAENMSDEKTTVVALLHDIVEDTDLTLDDLRQMDFPKDVIEAINTLTHKEGISYQEYIQNIGKNPIATEVKLQDLTHNMDLSRLDHISDKDLERLKKYKDNYDYLHEIYENRPTEAEDLTKENRMKAGLLGLAVGDALGVPVEFVSRDVLENNPVSEMQGYGTYKVPEGTWSDDTSLTIAAMDSVRQCKTVDYYDIMNKFSQWKNQAKYTATDEFFDIGMATSKAIHNFESGIEPAECGCRQVFENGNGSLMRMLPFAYYLASRNFTEEEKVCLINDASSLTHAHEISRLGCKIYSDYISFLLEGMDKEEALEAIGKIRYRDYYSTESIKKYNRLLSKNFKNLTKDEIASSGYVVDSLEASIWCTLNSENYEEAVKMAVNLGKDTDTIGAITGSLNGIIYGKKSIPKRWLDKLKRRKFLEDISTGFIETIENVQSKNK